MTVSAETFCKEKDLNGGTPITLNTYIFGSVTQNSYILDIVTITGKIPTKKESTRTLRFSSSLHALPYILIKRDISYSFL